MSHPSLDSATTTRDTAVIVNVLANDTDPDSDALSVTGLTAPANGIAVLNANGTVTYTPKAGFVGTDTFTYRASDGLTLSVPATVTIQVNAPTPVTTTSITAGAAPFTGTYKPVGDLSLLEGKNLTGTWTLEVHDTAKLKTGTLTSWSLTVLHFP